MTSRIVLLVLLMLPSLSIVAQQLPFGTWEMISIKGRNADGEVFRLDSTTVSETKIITPTHYILIARDLEKGEWHFNRCYFGTAKVEGDRYVEVPLLSSLRIFDNVFADFKWQTDGTRFIQSGSITRPDGKRITIDEFVFRQTEEWHSSAPLAGTWEYNSKNGRSVLVVTPTRWMMIVFLNEKFDFAATGNYRLSDDGNAMFAVEHTSAAGAEIGTAKHEGEKLTMGDKIFTRIK
jgi:hypothetical protein